jgi:hypothetical protein
MPDAIEAARASLQRKPSRLAWGVLACALAHENRLDEAGEAYAALAERYPGLIAEDYAKMAGSFAPDREWGDLMEAAMLRAAEAAADAEASA